MKSSNYQYLEKYFGASELRLLWENQPKKLLGTFNIELGTMEQSGPLLEEDIAKLAEALKTTSFYGEQFYRIVDEVRQNIMDRSPVLQLHRAWCDILQKSADEYQEWCRGLTDEERGWVMEWTQRLMFVKAMERHRERQVASYGPDGISPLDKIFHSLPENEKGEA